MLRVLGFFPDVYAALTELATLVAFLAMNTTHTYVVIFIITVVFVNTSSTTG